MNISLSLSLTLTLSLSLFAPCHFSPHLLAPPEKKPIESTMRPGVIQKIQRLGGRTYTRFTPLKVIMDVE